MSNFSNILFVKFAVSSPYRSLDLMTASYTCSFVLFFALLCFQKLSSLFHTARHCAILSVISFSMSAFLFSLHPRYLASVLTLTLPPFLNVTLFEIFGFVLMVSHLALLSVNPYWAATSSILCRYFCRVSESVEKIIVSSAYRMSSKSWLGGLCSWLSLNQN